METNYIGIQKHNVLNLLSQLKLVYLPMADLEKIYVGFGKAFMKLKMKMKEKYMKILVKNGKF